MDLRLLRGPYLRGLKPDLANCVSRFHILGFPSRISQERPSCCYCCCYARFLKTAWFTVSRKVQETAQGLQLHVLSSVRAVTVENETVQDLTACLLKAFQMCGL